MSEFSKNESNTNECLHAVHANIQYVLYILMFTGLILS